MTDGEEQRYFDLTDEDEYGRYATDDIYLKYDDIGLTALRFFAIIDESMDKKRKYLTPQN